MAAACYGAGPVADRQATRERALAMVRKLHRDSEAVRRGRSLVMWCRSRWSWSGPSMLMYSPLPSRGAGSSCRGCSPHAGHRWRLAGHSITDRPALEVERTRGPGPHLRAISTDSACTSQSLGIRCACC